MSLSHASQVPPFPTSPLLVVNLAKERRAQKARSSLASSILGNKMRETSPSEALWPQRRVIDFPSPKPPGGASSNPRKKGKSHKSKTQVCVVSPGQEIGFVRWTITFFIIVSTKSNIHLPHATRELQYTNSTIRHHVLRDHHNG